MRNTRVALKIAINVLLRLVATKVQLLGKPKSRHTIDKAEVNGFGFAPLFTRNRRSVNVTPFALLVTEHAEQVMHTMMNLHAHTEAMRDSRSGQLAFGIGIFAANHLLNPIMLKINERYPEASIQVVVGPPAELRDKLKNGDIEFFVAADDPEYHDDDTLRQKLYSEKLVIACRADHPLHRQDKISCLDLINYAAITYDGNFLKRQIYPLLSSAHEFELLKRNFPAIALQHPAVAAIAQYGVFDVALHIMGTHLEKSAPVCLKDTIPDHHTAAFAKDSHPAPIVLPQRGGLSGYDPQVLERDIPFCPHNILEITACIRHTGDNCFVFGIL